MSREVGAVTATMYRWRIMVGVSRDHDGEIDAGTARADVLIIASGGLDSFSITDGRGFWNNTEEQSLVVEHIGDERSRAPVYAVAESITKLLNQDEVWVTEEPVSLTRFIQ